MSDAPDPLGAQPAPPDVEPSPEGAPAPRPAPSRSRSLVRDYAETLLVAILVVLFTTTFAVQNSVIPTASMEDTLLIGDYLLVNKVIFAPEDSREPAGWLGQRPIRHGDIVIFKFPNEPKIDYIKRVMGLPGDIIEVRDKKVLRNGLPLDEPYVRLKTSIVFPRGSVEGGRDNYGPIPVPEGALFVMGDNRDYSADSREWGFVPRSHVDGRAFVIFWSRDQRAGSWQLRGTERARRFLSAISTFYRDTRWNRLFTLVE